MSRRTWLAAVAGSLLVGAVSAVSAQVMDTKVYSLVLFDRAEYGYSGDANPVVWDAIGWVGGDFSRLWFRADGEHSTVGDAMDLDVQALYGRLLSPYWDVLIGAQLEVRRASGVTETRVQAVLGLEGLAPYWFEIEPTVYVSQDGDLSASLTATYDLFVTQRLIAQPRLDVRAAAQEVPRFGVGAGLNAVVTGLRVRYELRREVAPYVGVEWARRFAGTATLARTAGAGVAEQQVVGGVRVWW